MEVTCTMDGFPTNPRQFAFPVSNGDGSNRGWGIIFQYTWGGIIMGAGGIGSATKGEKNLPISIDELQIFSSPLRDWQIKNLYLFNQTTHKTDEPKPTNK